MRMKLMILPLGYPLGSPKRYSFGEIWFIGRSAALLNHAQTISQKGVTIVQCKRKWITVSFPLQNLHSSESEILNLFRNTPQGKMRLRIRYWKLCILVSRQKTNVYIFRSILVCR